MLCFDAFVPMCVPTSKLMRNFQIVNERTGWGVLSQMSVKGKGESEAL